MPEKEPTPKTAEEATESIRRKEQEIEEAWRKKVVRPLRPEEEGS